MKMEKNLFMSVVNMISVISTLIFLMSGMFIAIFWGPKTVLGLSYIFVIIGMSVVYGILYIPILLSENWNLSKWGSVAMNATYFLLINVSVVVVGFHQDWFDAGNLRMLVGFEVCIILVYVLASVIRWISDFNTASKMNDKLRQIRGVEKKSI